MTARLYDAMHDPAKQDVADRRRPTPAHSGFTHPFFRTPHSVEDLKKDRDAIAEWARMTYGFMGRSPDYKAAFLGTLGANSEFYEPYAGNARRWYEESQEKLLYWNHAIINPPVDRHRDPDEVSDVFMHVEEENDNGRRGLRSQGRGDRLGDHPLQLHRPLRPADQEREYSLVCTVPMGAPGMKLICRPSYAHRPASWAARSTTRCPPGWTRTTPSSSSTRSSIPWENVFIYGDPRRPPRSSPAPASCTASPSTASPGWRSSWTSSQGC